MLNTQFSPWPSYTREEAEAAEKVLLSNKVNYWTGNECREFEKEFAIWNNSKYAIALANGTIALDMALVALGVSKGDEVIVTSRTFLASVSCVVNIGAIPIFVDVSLDSQNISPANIEKAITNNTKAIICVHLAGWPCDMDEIMALSNKYGLKVIEDCAQAHGAIYKDKPVGSIGHIGAWSFCQDKIITTAGEGGMCTTNDYELWSKIWSYKDHGKSFDAVYRKDHAPGFRWVHESFGTNGRLTEIQAAIGRIQLKRMKEWTEKRTANALRIRDACQLFSAIRVPVLPEFIKHAWYKCYVFVIPELLNAGWNRDKIINEFNYLGVPCYSGSCSEVYLEKAFENTSFRPVNRLNNAKELGETSLMFLVHPTLKEIEISKTCEVVKKIFAIACKA